LGNAKKLSILGHDMLKNIDSLGWSYLKTPDSWQKFLRAKTFSTGTIKNGNR
jgi:hypothetical protein